MYTEKQTGVWSQKRPEAGMEELAYIQYHNSGPSLRLEPSIFFPSMQTQTGFHIILYIPRVFLRLKKDLRVTYINASWSLRVCFNGQPGGTRRSWNPTHLTPTLEKAKACAGSISWVTLSDPMSKTFKRRMKSCQWSEAVSHSEECISWEWRWTQTRNFRLYVGIFQMVGWWFLRSMGNLGLERWLSS